MRASVLRQGKDAVLLAREVNSIGMLKRSMGATEDGVGVDDMVGAEVASGVGEADTTKVNPISTPKRLMGVTEDVVGLDGAVRVEVAGGAEHADEVVRVKGAGEVVHAEGIDGEPMT